MKMNLPNKLTVLRLIMVPIFMVVMLLPVFIDFHNETVNTVLNIAGVLLFIIASLTDMLDGKIARKNNLVTDFGKFMDPLADKFLVLGSFLAILYRYEQMKSWLFWAVLVVIFREFAVTSIRLVVSSSSGVVIAANWLGKVKTVTQMTSIIVLLLEPVIYHAIEKNGTELPEFFNTYPPVTVILCALMTVFTVWSGVNYLAAYWGYLDPEK